MSTATVSRVMHGQDNVSPATRQRVLEVIEAMGYVPDSAAQSMVRRSKEVVGLVAIEPRSPDTQVEQEGLLFIEEVLRGVEATLSPLGWPVLISVRRAADDGDAYQWLQQMSGQGRRAADRRGHRARRAPGQAGLAHPGRAGRRFPGRAACRRRRRRQPRGHQGAGQPPDRTARPDQAVLRRRAARRHRTRGNGAPPSRRTLARHPGARLAGSFEGRFAALSGQLAVREILAAPRRRAA